MVNYELPHVAEDYVHRIGRTGRAGVEGEALSLVCVDEVKLLKEIEHLLKRSLPSQVIAGFVPDPNARPEPIEMGRRSQDHVSPRCFEFRDSVFPTEFRLPPAERRQLWPSLLPFAQPEVVRALGLPMKRPTGKSAVSWCLQTRIRTLPSPKPRGHVQGMELGNSPPDLALGDQFPRIETFQTLTLDLGMDSRLMLLQQRFCIFAVALDLHVSLHASIII